MVVQKRSVLGHSVAVVRDVALLLRKTKVVLALVIIFLALRITLPFFVAPEQTPSDPETLRQLSKCAAGTLASCGSRTRQYTLTGFQALMTVVAQYAVAIGVIRVLIGNEQQGHSGMKVTFRPRPSQAATLLCLCVANAALMTTTAGSSIGFGWALAAGASFLISYITCYVVPALAIYDTGLRGGTSAAVRAISLTWNADAFAWSGIWLTTGVFAVVSAIPAIIAAKVADASPHGWGHRVGRISNLALGIPAQILAECVSAAFVTSILYVVATRSFPSEIRQDALATVCGQKVVDYVAESTD